MAEVTAPKASTTSKKEEATTNPAIVDDTAFDHGTRFRPARNVPPTQHLGGRPLVLTGTESETLDKNLPALDEDKIVIPTANVPIEILVQRLVDKALSEKDKEEFTPDLINPGPPKLTPEEAAKHEAADREATEKAEKEQTESVK